MIDFDLGGDPFGEDGPGPEIDMTPMIDVIFQLLIFFVLTSFTFIPALGIALPKSSQAKPASMEIVVSIQASGAYFVGGAPCAPGDLESAIARAGGEEGARLSIRADERVGFGLVLRVLDAATALGMKAVGFVTDKVDEPEAHSGPEGP